MVRLTSASPLNATSEALKAQTVAVHSAADERIDRPPAPQHSTHLRCCFKVSAFKAFACPQQVYEELLDDGFKMREQLRNEAGHSRSYGKAGKLLFSRPLRSIGSGLLLAPTTNAAGGRSGRVNDRASGLLLAPACSVIARCCHVRRGRTIARSAWLSPGRPSPPSWLCTDWIELMCGCVAPAIPDFNWSAVSDGEVDKGG